MFITIGTALAGLVGKKATEGVARVIGIIALVLGLIVVAAIVVKVHDHNVISSHEAKQSAANAVADRKADTGAAVQRRVDDRTLSAEEVQLKGVREDAKVQTAADRRLARQRCIRLQQAARAAKRESPAC